MPSLDPRMMRDHLAVYVTSKIGTQLFKAEFTIN